MPNKTNDWLDDLLDRHPAEPVPSGFAERVKQQLAQDEATPVDLVGSTESMEPVVHDTVLHRFTKPLLTAAAAALLISIGYMMGAGAGPDFRQIDLGDGPASADTDQEIEEIYQARDLLDSWELMSDSDLEMSFRQLNEQDADWLEELLVDPAEANGGDEDGANQ